MRVNVCLLHSVTSVSCLFIIYSPVPGSGTLASDFRQPHPASGKPSGPMGQGASKPIVKILVKLGAKFHQNLDEKKVTWWTRRSSVTFVTFFATFSTFTLKILNFFREIKVIE